MSVSPTAPSLIATTIEFVTSAISGITGLFGQKHADLGASPEHVLGTTPGIDPRFIPRTPMSNANLDVGLLTKLSNEGYKRGKEITRATHPELYRIWEFMCQRAGLGRVPQLIIADSKTPNAASLFQENAVVISTGLLTKLDLRELSAVLGHELGHETSNHQKPRALAYAVLGGGGLLLGNAFANRGGFGALIKEVENPGMLRRMGQQLFGKGKKPDVLASELYMAGGFGLGTVAARQLSVRPTELDADSKGAHISGDPHALASALLKLEDMRSQQRGGIAMLDRALHSVLSGYPSSTRRIRRLEQMAQHMPPGIRPAYTMITEAPDMPSNASPHAAPAPGSPGATIHAVSGVDRLEKAAEAAIQA